METYNCLAPTAITPTASLVEMSHVNWSTVWREEKILNTKDLKAFSLPQKKKKYIIKCKILKKTCISIKLVIPYLIGLQSSTSTFPSPSSLRFLWFWRLSSAWFQKESISITRDRFHTSEVKVHTISKWLVWAFKFNTNGLNLIKPFTSATPFLKACKATLQWWCKA